MSSPTLVDSDATTFVGTATKVATVSVQPGDVVVNAAGSENGSWQPGAPSGGGLTWTNEAGPVGTTDQYGSTRMSSAVANATTSLGVSQSVTSGYWGHVAAAFRGSDGIGAVASNQNAGTAPSLSITTTQDNSAILVIIADWNATSGSNTWRQVNGSNPVELGDYPGDGARWGAHIAYYADAGTAGSKTVGMTAPTPQKPSVIAIEILGTASGEAHSTSAGLSGSGTLSVALLVALAGAATLAGSGALAAGALLSTSSGAALSGSGSLTAGSQPAAAGTVGLSGSGALTAQTAPAPAASVDLTGAGSLSAGAQPATATTAALSGSGGLSATATPAAATGPALTGSGALSAVPTGGSSDTAAFSGAGVLAAAASPKPSGVANLAGDGALTTTQAPAAAAGVALSGSGTLAAVAGNDFAGAAALSGAGQLTANRTPALAGVATLTGSGALTTTWLPAGGGSAALSGSGTLAATGYNPGAARDITVTGSLGTRWTGALGATTRPTAALATRWKGTLT